MAAGDDRMPVILYLADPMCSWCWGFSPVIGELAEDYADRADLRVIAGGLFPGTAEPMDRHFKASVREHWEHVEQRTGQPFDFSFFERDDFVYDTEPACRAVVAARELDRSRVLEMLRGLHHAFYAENRDITERGVATEVAADVGIDADRFCAALESDTIRDRMRHDFRLAHELGMRGFPTLMGYDHERVALLTEGYAPADRVREALEQWLTQVEPETTATGNEFCEGMRNE